MGYAVDRRFEVSENKRLACAGSILYPAGGSAVRNGGKNCYVTMQTGDVKKRAWRGTQAVNEGRL